MKIKTIKSLHFHLFHHLNHQQIHQTKRKTITTAIVVVHHLLLNSPTENEPTNNLTLQIDPLLNPFGSNPLLLNQNNNSNNENNPLLLPQFNLNGQMVIEEQSTENKEEAEMLHNSTN